MHNRRTRLVEERRAWVLRLLDEAFGGSSDS